MTNRWAKEARIRSFFRILFCQYVVNVVFQADDLPQTDRFHFSFVKKEELVESEASQDIGELARRASDCSEIGGCIFYY